MKFCIKDFCNKCDQIYSFLLIWLHLLKKSLMESFNFCAVVLREKIYLKLVFFIMSQLCFSYFAEQRLVFSSNSPKKKLFILPLSLREKCPYSEFFLSVFFRIQSKCGKIRTRKTPNTNTLHAVYQKRALKKRYYSENLWKCSTKDFFCRASPSVRLAVSL